MLYDSTWAEARPPKGPMPAIQTICVYCGSGFGSDPVFVQTAAELGRLMAEQGINLVYGGGNVGLMGTVARSVLDHGGYVTGIIPDFLKSREKLLDDVQETVVVPDMHTRKRLMFERADAFVALPGGIGTFEEFFEAWSWRMLNFHQKPVALLDQDGYYQPLLQFLQQSVRHGFMNAAQMDLLTVGDEPASLLPRLVQVAGLDARPVDISQI